MPDLSVAICTYNNARLLNRTLNSIADQRVKSNITWEVVVVQNNCTDQTHEIIDKHARKGNLPKFRTVNEPRQGVSHARIRAYHETDAPWIAFVDDDCLLNECWVQSAVDFCLDHPNLGAMNGRNRLEWEKPPGHLARRFKAGFASLDYGDKPLNLTDDVPVHMVGAGLVVNRRALQDSEWPQESVLSDRTGERLGAGGDMEIVLRIRQAGYELWYNPAMQLRHFIPASRVEPSYICNLYRGFAESSAILAALEEEEISPDLSWRIRWLVERLVYFFRRLGAYIYHDVLRNSTWATTFRFVQVYEGWGGVVGAFRMLIHGIPNST
ncbi:glycosyltransferase involved in cell wall biosynthesis [Salinibacter ruber]|uniref:glycosyltransferase family 2 protein n=1 Tax=Salinibacter ruber TaxID=146919 RepID=UPI0021697C85|nr:glycosyltransferase family 2 protein [Salinibacter ruber]MCS3748869.1 glycosyltransferase involved in cell wall biosynthesis [Salinibacter ruber]